MPNDVCEVAESASWVDADEATRSGLLQHYEAIAQASCAMLAAARSDNWIEVAWQEERCCVLIAVLKAAADCPGEPLNAADNSRRMQLLRRILANDALIRARSEPWLEPLTAYISTSRAAK